MGRSRGGLTTKIHAVVDADGNPITLKLSEGQAHDGRSAADMLDTVGPGQTLLADRAYDSDALRQSLANRGASANVKPMPHRVNIPPFSPYLYRFRNLVVSSTSSNISGPSPRVSKNTTQTISHSSNSPPPESGCGL
jgi:transposase